MNIKFLLTAALMTIFIGCSKEIEKVNTADLSTSTGVEQLATVAGFKANELHIKLKPGISDQRRNQIFSKVSGSVIKHILTKAMERLGDKDGFYTIHIPGNVPEAVKKLNSLRDVEYAEPNYEVLPERSITVSNPISTDFLYSNKKTLNDPFFVNGSLWNMYSNQSTPYSEFGSQAPEAWKNGNIGSRRVVVGIVGQGVMYEHEDLKANFRNNIYDPIDGIDNDGNGYIDDIHGWDFYYGDNTLFDGDSQDDLGTAIAGVIGAVGGNAKGVIGVSPLVSMLSGKFSGASFSYTEDIVESIDYMTDMKLRHNMQLVAINASWGSFEYSQVIKDAIDRAGVAGILFITGAGPYFRDIDAGPAHYYPACYTSENIITVGGIDSTGYKDFYSSWGSISVDLFAPGTIVYSTIPGPNNSSAYGGYYYVLATPHVTGAVALYAAKHPNATAAEIKAAILGNATPTLSLNGLCVTGARLNLSGF